MLTDIEQDENYGKTTEHAQQFQGYGDKGSKKSVANTFATSLKCSKEGFYNFTLFPKENNSLFSTRFSLALHCSPQPPHAPQGPLHQVYREVCRLTRVGLT